MKKSLFVTVLGVLSGSIGGVAHADQLRVTGYDMDDQGGSVNLESDAPMGEPWMRIEGKMLKIWFPHIDQVSRFDHERDSAEPIKALALRSGGSDTGMLRVELGSQRHVNREDISIVRNGQQATVRVRMPVPGKPAAAAYVEPQAARAPQALPAQVPAPVAPQPVAAAPQALAAAAPAAQEPVAKEPSPLGAAGTKADDDADALGALRDDSERRTSPIVWLGFATLVLGGAWAGLQLLQKRKKPQRELPSIEVVGTRRLGPKQELMIVRALGSDHLLLCTNGHAERVASSPSPTGLALPAELPAEPAQSSESQQRPSQAGGIGIISRLSSQHRLRKLLDSVDNEGDAEGHEGDFGEELASVTRKHRRPSLHSLPPASPSMPAPRMPSEAVAGITRLRQRKSS